MQESDGTSTEISALKKEIQQWAFGVRCVFAVINLLPLYYCTRLLLLTPKLETMFEDMLGSTSRIPVLTQAVLRFWPLFLGAIWLLSALCILLIFALKRARHVWMTAVVSLAVMIGTGHLVATLLLDPVVQMMVNLSGGGP